MNQTTEKAVDVPQFFIPFTPMEAEEHPYNTRRAFFPSKSGKFHISCVAGVSNYSKPRKCLRKAADYSALELAIFDSVTLEWASYTQLKEAGAFDVIGKGDYQDTSYDYDKESEFPMSASELAQPQLAVFGWVSIEDIRLLWSRI